MQYLTRFAALLLLLAISGIEVSAQQYHYDLVPITDMPAFSTPPYRPEGKYTWAVYDIEGERQFLGWWVTNQDSADKWSWVSGGPLTGPPIPSKVFNRLAHNFASMQRQAGGGDLSLSYTNTTTPELGNVSLLTVHVPAGMLDP